MLIRATVTNHGYVKKFDPAGNELWTKPIDDTEHTAARGVAADGNGNVYVVGDVYMENAVGRDLFIRKLDGNGNELWVEMFEGDPGGAPRDARWVPLAYLRTLRLREQHEAGAQ